MSGLLQQGKHLSIIVPCQPIFEAATVRRVPRPLEERGGSSPWAQSVGQPGAMGLQRAPAVEQAPSASVPSRLRRQHRCSPAPGRRIFHSDQALPCPHQAFFESHPAPSAERTIQQCCENILLNAAWLKRDAESLHRYLLQRRAAPVPTV